MQEAFLLNAARRERLELEYALSGAARCATSAYRCEFEKAAKDLKKLTDAKKPNRRSMTLTEALHRRRRALGWFQELGYCGAPCPDLAPGEPAAERQSFAIVGAGGPACAKPTRRLNPANPDDARRKPWRQAVWRLATRRWYRQKRLPPPCCVRAYRVEVSPPDGQHRRRLMYGWSTFADASANDCAGGEPVSVRTQHNRRPGPWYVFPQRLAPGPDLSSRTPPVEGATHLGALRPAAGPYKAEDSFAASVQRRPG